MSSSCQAPVEGSESREGVLLRLLQEAIGAHAAPAVVEEVLHRARSVATSPGGGGRIGAVLSEAVCACAEVLGADVAEMVRREVEMLLGPVLQGEGGAGASGDARNTPPMQKASSPASVGSREELSPDAASEVTVEIEVDVEEEWPSDVYSRGRAVAFEAPTRPRDRLAPAVASAGASLEETAGRASTPETVVPGAPRRIVFVTARKGFRSALHSGLPPDASLEVVDSLFGLLDVAEACEGSFVVVLDRVVPAVGCASVATVWPDLPRGTRLVLWGGQRSDLEEIRLLLGDETLGRVTLVPDGLDHLVACLLES